MKYIMFVPAEVLQRKGWYNRTVVITAIVINRINKFITNNSNNN